MIAGRRENFDMALRFDLNPPSERGHISLIARARFAQWTGSYALRVGSRRARSLRCGDLTILSGRIASRCDLAVRASVTPKIQIFFCKAQAHALALIERAQLSSAHTYVCVS